MSSVEKEYYEYLDKLDKEELITRLVNLESQNNELSNENYELGGENEQLKQQLHNLPKKIMEEIKGKQPNFTENSYGFTTKQGWDICVEILATILKKYGGER